MKAFFKNHLYITIVASVVAMTFFWFLLVVEGEYGWTMFFSLPVCFGLIWGYLSEYNSATFFKTSAWNLLVGLIVLCLFMAVLVALGIEGAICIIMAVPFIFVPLYVMFIIGMIAKHFDKKRTLNVIFLFIFLGNPATYIFDKQNAPIEECVSTELVVHSSKEEVWNLLNTKIDFNTPEFILFQKGVSYPKSIEKVPMEDRFGYRCITNNDRIDLIIDSIDENKRIQFSLLNQTIPMKEVSPYDEIDAKHLHNYFLVNFGELQLQPLSGDSTKLVARTRYSYKIAPKWYWKLWSNYIIDEMQMHVLHSIKTQVEN